MPGGACRPGYARETERADLNRVTRTVSSMITVKLADIVPKDANCTQSVPKWTPNPSKMVPEWSQNGLQIGIWSVPGSEPHFGINFGRYFTSIWTAHGPQKAYKINDFLMLKMHIEN